MSNIEVIEPQGWCPDHRNYYEVAIGCDVCNYESINKNNTTTCSIY